MQKQTKFSIFVILTIIFSSHIIMDKVYGEPIGELNVSFNQAKEHLQKGEYKQSIVIYDQILEIRPNDISTLNMKGIAFSNIEDHAKSLKQFFKVLQKNPKDLTALTGMGMGFGNLGEYEESLSYLNKAHNENPKNIVVKNYKQIIENVIKKYPYMPTEKPINFKKQINGNVPNWIKDTTNWWSLGKINDQDFFKNIEHMIKKNIIRIPGNQSFENKEEKSAIKSNLIEWGKNKLSNKDFFKNIQWLLDNKFIDIKKSQEDIDHETYLFEKYLKNISININEEKRYIEYSNPSQDVIKKFLRDYVKWNFDEQVKMPSTGFPDPTYEIINDTYIIKYKVYINDQPAGLPLDHVSTLENSFEFWESQELKTNNQKAKMIFEITKLRYEANVWVTWVVRDMGEGVLGHAHLGKGVVEVALGDYSCDGSFQLYDVETVEQIMTHELGHSIGLTHTNDKENIMYPSMTPHYAYCLLN